MRSGAQGSRRLGALLLLLGAVIAATVFVRRDRPRPPPFEGPVDLGQGVRVERRELAGFTYVVVTIHRRGGASLRAYLAGGGIRPLTDLQQSMGALAAVNGDYHETEGFLLGKTYSTLVTGARPGELGQAPILGRRQPNDACFWLDDERVPHVGPLDIGVSLGIVADVSQGLHHSQSQATLVTDLVPKGGLPDKALAFPLEALGGSTALTPTPAAAGLDFRVIGPGSRSLALPAVVVKGDALAAVATALAPGTKIRLSVSRSVRLAIGTGPHLLERGAIHPSIPPGDEAWSRYPRTAVGLSQSHVFLVASVQPRNRARMSELARGLLELGCTDAVNLDGGPSSGLAVGGSLVNEAPGFEGIVNDVGSALGVCTGTPGLDDLR